MGTKVKIGIASIKIGDIASDGGMSANLEVLGNTAEDSCKINFEDGEETKFFVEEHDNPIYVQTKQGAINIQFQIPEYDLDTVAKVMGGTVTGTAGNKVYKAPMKGVTIEKSLQIENQVGAILRFPRVQITGKFTSDIGKKNLMALDIKANVLNPTKSGVSRFEIQEK